MSNTLIQLPKCDYSSLDFESIIDDVKIENRDVGKIIFIKDGYPVIVCGKGLLKITEAVYLNDAKSIFPLKKFRIRLR